MSSHYNIINFLEEHRVEKGCEHTHMSMGKPYGSFMIPDDEYSIFLELYPLMIVSVLLLFTVATSFCGIYRLFGLSTCKTDLEEKK